TAGERDGEGRPGHPRAAARVWTGPPDRLPGGPRDVPRDPRRRPDVSGRSLACLPRGAGVWPGGLRVRGTPVAPRGRRDERDASDRERDPERGLPPPLSGSDPRFPVGHVGLPAGRPLPDAARPRRHGLVRGDQDRGAPRRLALPRDPRRLSGSGGRPEDPEHERRDEKLRVARSETVRLASRAALIIRPRSRRVSATPGRSGPRRTPRRRTG